MVNEINQQLETVCKKLTGMNYVCSIEIFSGSWVKGKDYPNYLESEAEEKTVKSIMNDEIIIHELTKISFDEVIKALESGLSHSGGEGYYPNKRYFGTDEYKYDLKTLRQSISKLFQGCSKIFKFEIIDGHPFYPAFWEFSFLLKHKNIGYVFIGSSCD